MIVYKIGFTILAYYFNALFGTLSFDFFKSGRYSRHYKFICYLLPPVYILIFIYMQLTDLRHWLDYGKRKYIYDKYNFED